MNGSLVFLQDDAKFGHLIIRYFRESLHFARALEPHDRTPQVSLRLVIEKQRPVLIFLQHPLGVFIFNHAASVSCSGFQFAQCL